jgi:hypothetical protein
MTQREQAMRIIGTIRNIYVDGLDSQIEKLHELVRKAQNGPPDGEADGSLDDENWTRLRDVCNALLKAGAGLDDLVDFRK